MTRNLVQVILDECNRMRNEVIPEYENLPNGAGRFAVAMMKLAIRQGESAITSGDVVECIEAFNALRGFHL